MGSIIGLYVSSEGVDVGVGAGVGVIAGGGADVQPVNPTIIAMARRANNGLQKDAIACFIAVFFATSRNSWLITLTSYILLNHIVSTLSLLLFCLLCLLF